MQPATLCLVGEGLRQVSGKYQSSLLTQRQQLLSLRLRFWGLIQQVGNVGPSAPLQARGDPLQIHGRFLAKAARPHDL